ncbi:protein of unknown function DUF962 [Ferrimonas balearica DSM 9799]|uniref:PRS2 protein n=1 Tax=Ferrimonas balearica (strain DSM 9799 / CCM 4581 / KCTC 23876 / PAT) TaxID=550540 RepID=E1SP66_FERBD|nr:Mpo1-like protein [Ferrimonas balearica]ADN75691.1 protein of unknown function DUF962 [Ferrimonas balearica DSM 9799]
MLDKNIQQWLNAYGVSHQNPINKTIHWICVPIIMWTVLALLWEVHLPGQPLLNLALVLIVISLLFYWRLSRNLAIGMVGVTASMVGIILWHQATLAIPLWQSALTLFVVAWIFQFIGHKIEGKKPSFFEDIQFLLIGPIWLLSFIYRKLGIPYRPAAQA